MKKFLTFAGLALVLAASASSAPAQEQQRQDAPRPGAERHERKPFGRRGHGRMGGGHGLKALERLNLTDAQRTQIRSIQEATRQRTESQRAELRQLFETRRGGGQLTPEQQARAVALRDELEAARESAHQQALALLTAEQRAQLEQWQQERRSRRRGMRKHRQPSDNEQQ